MSADPEVKEEKEEKTDVSPGSGPSPTLLESISSKRATIWNGLTSRMKSDRTTPNGTGSDIDYQPATANNKSDSLSFMESVKLKLKKVHQQYERTEGDSDEEKSNSGIECAPLIDTADESNGNHSVTETDNATTHSEMAAAESVTDAQDAGPRRKKLTKRQDSFTAEEIYLDTVAAKVKSGLIPPDPVDSSLISPSKAVKEFIFTDTTKAKPKPKQKKPTPINNNRLTVNSSNLINFDSIQNLSSAAAQSAEIVVHREDDDVFDYESSG